MVGEVGAAASSAVRRRRVECKDVNGMQPRRNLPPHPHMMRRSKQTWYPCMPCRLCLSGEFPPDPKREDPPNEEVDGDRGIQKKNELHDDLGNVDGAGYHCGLPRQLGMSLFSAIRGLVNARDFC